MRNFIKTTIEEFINEQVSIVNSIKEFIELDDKAIEDIVNRNKDFDEYQFDTAKTALLNLQDVLKNNNTLTLYRVLSVNDVSDINTSNLGNHYTLSLDNLDDVTLYDIGIDETKKLYSVKVTSLIDNINLQETINAHVNYPFEQEVFLDNSDNIKILDIAPF